MQGQTQSISVTSRAIHNNSEAHREAVEAGLHFRQLSLKIESEIGFVDAYIAGLEIAIENMGITQGDMPKAQGLLNVARIAKSSLRAKGKNSENV